MFNTTKIFTDTIRKEKLEDIEDGESSNKTIKFYKKYNLKCPFGLNEK